ncbi:MAG: ankyrin repeat domain-containing protein [Spirochaetales bacterium]|nr:ankyrin repeat domain-containing protein [Spirochaetales bacterium]
MTKHHDFLILIKYMEENNKKKFNPKVLLPLIPVVVILVILGAIFIPDIMRTIILILFFIPAVSIPCILAFFIHGDLFAADDKKSVVKKIARGFGVLLFGAILTAIFIMAGLQDGTKLFTKALCPVGFTYITAKPVTRPYEKKDDYGNMVTEYRRTVEVTARNEGYYYVLDEFPVISCIVIVYLFSAFLLFIPGYFINKRCMRKGRPKNRFLYLPLLNLFILLVVFVPSPVSDVFMYGVRGIIYKGWTPLLYNVVEDYDVDGLNALIKKGANINTKDSFDETPLFKAVDMGSINMVRTLLDLHAWQNFKNREGNTPLMIAVDNNDKEIVTLLLKAGANVYIKNKEGKTAMEMAAYEEKQDIIEIFHQAGYP